MVAVLPNDGSYLKIIEFRLLAGRMVDMTTDTMIGLDLTKNGFQVHEASTTGKIEFRKSYRGYNFASSWRRILRATVVMEACGNRSPEVYRRLHS